jgi:hypothetical protein
MSSRKKAKTSKVAAVGESKDAPLPSPTVPVIVAGSTSISVPVASVGGGGSTIITPATHKKKSALQTPKGGVEEEGKFAGMRRVGRSC